MNAPKHILLSTFCSQLETFVSELKKMYPDDPDFALASTTIGLVKSVNPNMLLNQFYEASKSYESQILTKNEHFFLDHDFAEFGADFNLLAKLKEYVKSMSPSSKTAVWAYIQNLYRLASAYTN